MKQLFIFILLLILVLLIHSCDQGKICQDPITSNVNAGFYKYEYGVSQDTSLQNFSVRGIQIPDTISFDTLFNENSIKLPLPQESDSCLFVFSFAIYDSVLVEGNDPVQEFTWSITHYVEDTLRLTFSRQIYLLSANCGFAYSYELLTISHTRNSIRSAEIVNSEIGTFNEQNITLFF